MNMTDKSDTIVPEKEEKFIIPDSIKTHIKDCIDNLPEKTILSYAHTLDMKTKIRPVHTNVSLFRNKIFKDMIYQIENNEYEMYIFDSKAPMVHRVNGPFGGKWEIWPMLPDLKTHKDADCINVLDMFFAIYGKDETLSSMLLDYRPDVRALAISLITDPESYTDRKSVV